MSERWYKALMCTKKNAGAKRQKRLKRRPNLEFLEERLTPTTNFLAVGAGDATSHDAILWTRAQDSVSTAGVGLIAQVTTDQTFATGLAAFAGTTDPTQDYTIHIDATGLQSGTQYFYRFVATDSVISQVGTFTTAPDPTAQVGVHLGMTGDADGLLRPYPSTSNVTAPGVPSFAQQDFNYFVWLGDTIYETASGSAGNNNSPAVPSSSVPANIDPNVPGALSTMEQAYWTKYKQQLQPVSTGTYAGLGDSNPAGLQGFFDSTGHYTVLDNHELGNKQLINGGAPAGTNPVGIGVDPTNTANDVNTSGTYINQSPAFKTIEQAYYDYQPIRFQTVNSPSDPRSNGTEQLYFSQQWGANTSFFNLDDRSYRDIRMKTTSGADDTGVRADNPGRTMLGQTQLQWVEQGLLAAQNNGVTWKFVAISSPIDQIGPIGGSFTINNAGDPNTTQPNFTISESDGGKSWMGAYRFERNQLLQFIANNNIQHVVFLTTDDHQVRINEVGYFTQFNANGTPIQSSYTRVPGAMEILVGPIAATGPDLITDHSIANIQALANSFASQQSAMGIDPIGLDPNFPGLTNVSREGDPNANTNRSPFDFYSPDTFNYVSLNVDPTGHNLTVTVNGINSYATNTFPQPDPNNPVRQIMQFTITTNGVNAQADGFNLPKGGTTTVNGTVATFTDPNIAFQAGNLLLSHSYYAGNASTVTIGQTLPGGGTAIANGTYPKVFQNNTVDGSFGVTSPLYLDQLTPSGATVSSLNLTAASGNTLVTSFSSKSEGALNVSTDGAAVTFMDYQAGINALDVSNSNTPGVIDPTNPVTTSPTYRQVVQLDANGNFTVTPTNAYSGNNGRAAILANGTYYTTGNAGNSGSGVMGTTLSALSDDTGVQSVAAGGGPNTNVVGVVNGTTGMAKGYQRGFAVGNTNPATGLPYGPDDKTGKDDNYRGETIFNNTLYVTKGSGGNGINTVYQVGTAGALPPNTPNNVSTTPIAILPGLPTTLATKLTNVDNTTTTNGAYNATFNSGLGAGITFYPFGIWFANSTTLYIADEGAPVTTLGSKAVSPALAALDPNAGLEKWSLVGGTWHLDYTLQTGLNLGVAYSVANGPNGEVYPVNLDPATAGLRNLTGKVNADGTVTLYAVTSTASTSGDQGADPNRLVAITDNLGFTTPAQASNEVFSTLRTARYGEVLRGISFTPNPAQATTSSYAAAINWGDGTPSTTGNVTLSGSTYSVAGNHTYAANGTYFITTTITHNGVSTQTTGVAVVGSDYQHVMLISVDGLRQADIADPALAPYLTNIKALQATGTTYTNATTSTPSDSFPGELNYLTGASPGATGVFYDDSYNRTFLPPAIVGGTTPGTEALYAEPIDYNFANISGTNSSNVGYNASAIDPVQLPLSSVVAVTNETDPAVITTATITTYQLKHSPIENDGQVSGSVNGATFTTSAVAGLGSDTVSLNVTANGTTLASGILNLSSGLLTLVWGTAPQSTQITVSYNYGIPVYPHNDLKVNTVLGVVSGAGLPTAWSDKHAAYDIAAGPNGQAVNTTINDLFTPEINSTVALDTAHPAHPLVPGSNITTQLVDSSYNPNNVPLPSGDTTSSVATTLANDSLKVQATINEINGKNSLGTVTNGFSPSVFGMNFQGVSVGEKLAKNPDGTVGGIQINPMTGQEVLSANIKNGFGGVDADIGQIVAALKANNSNPNLANFNNTLVVLTAKHGQNPRLGTSKNIGDPITPALQAAGITPALVTEDDVALIWLDPAQQASQSAAALAALQHYAATSPNQEVNQILPGSQLAALGLGDPTKNDRTPDFIITLKPGFIYTGSTKKIAEHGGFSPDDTHVALILASGNAALAKNKTVTTSVSTMQVAVTTLQALGLNPGQLQGAAAQHTQALPTAAGTTVMADLGVPSITHTVTPTLVGGKETFIVTVKNNGPGVISNVNLVNQVLDSKNMPGFVAGSVTATPSSGIYNATTGYWSISLLSGSTATLTVTGTVASTAQGNLVDTATVFPGPGVIDPLFGNNVRTDTVAIAQLVSVGISPMMDNVSGLGVPGLPVTFTFTVSNSGPNVANGVTVMDTLPAGFLPNGGIYSTTVAGGATVTNPTGSNTNSINTTVNLPVSGSVTFTFTGMIDPSFTGSALANTATINTGSSLSNTNQNTSTTDNLTITATADLQVTIGDNSNNQDIAPNGTVTYSIFVTNNGPSAVSGATFDAFPDASLANATYTGPNNPTATPVPIDPGFGIPHISDTISSLAPGSSVTYTVTGTAPAAGSLTTVATVNPPGTVTDPNLNNNTATDNITVQLDAGAQGLANIQHFVVIYQENWSFDGLYGSFPGANGIANASPTALSQLDRVTGNPYTSQIGQPFDLSVNGPALTTPPQPINNNVSPAVIDSRFPAGLNTLAPYNLTQFIQPTDHTGDIVHRFWQEQSQINQGAQNQYVTWSDNPGLVMSNFDATNLPEGLLAQQYTMDDNFFHAAFGGSFLNHQFLVAAEAPVYQNAAALNPGAIALLDSTGQLALDPVTHKIIHDGSITPIGGTAFGNTTNPGQVFTKNYVINTTFSKNLAPSFVGNNTAASLLPSQNDNNPNAPNYIPTIGDTLNAANVSWKWYSGGWNAALASSPSNPANNGHTPANPTVDPNFQWHHQPLAYYNNFAPWVNGQVNPMSAAHLQDETNFFSDLSSGNLPAVSFIKPLGPDNEHPGYASLLQGQQHVADIVHAIQNSPQWANTAVIITYDENGGRWDHVSAPDANGIWGDGTRVPTIVISPYANTHFVDHTQHDTLSILKTIENRFNVAPMTQYDAAATSLATSFTNTATLNLNTAYLQPDAITPGKNALIVGGTQGNDTINVALSGGKIVVTVNSAVVGPAGGFDPTTISRLEIYGQTGSDSITVDPAITSATLPAFVFGGSGGGNISTGSNSLVIGGQQGTTKINAGANSIEIAGSGLGQLTSTNGSAILIPGNTLYNNNLKALEAIMAEWGRSDIGYNQKVTDLLGPTPVAGSKNNGYFLNTSTVSSNHQHNTLAGAANANALDWFFSNPNFDMISGFIAGETLTTIS
jgi:acid phosphatase